MLAACQLYSVALLLLITVNKRSLHSPLFEENSEDVCDELEPGQYWEILLLQYLINSEYTGSVNHLKKSKLNLLNTIGCSLSVYSS